MQYRVTTASGSAGPQGELCPAPSFEKPTHGGSCFGGVIASPLSFELGARTASPQAPEQAGSENSVLSAALAPQPRRQSGAGLSRSPPPALPSRGPPHSASGSRQPRRCSAVGRTGRPGSGGARWLIREPAPLPSLLQHPIKEIR